MSSATAALTGVVVTSPTDGATLPPTVHVVASGSETSPVTAMQIYDNNSLLQTVNSDHMDLDITLSVGAHTLAFKDWYNNGTTAGAITNVHVTVTAPPIGVTVTEPTSGATLSSPIHVVASGRETSAVTAMQIYDNGMLVYSVNADTIDTQLGLAPGAHTLDFKDWYDACGTAGAITRVQVTVDSTPIAINPTTTYSDESSPNTSAASNFASIWPFANGDAVGNVSRMAMRELLYCGATTATYAHVQGWFGDPARHKNVGYDSQDPAQVTKQVTEMIARGISGAIVDWYGPSDQSNTVTQLLLSNAGHLGGTFKVGVMIDQGAITCTTGTPEDCMVTRINQVSSSFAGDSNYARNASGHPLVWFFAPYTGYDWSNITARIPAGIDLVFENQDALTDAHSNGGFAWVQPPPLTSDFGMSYLSDFYAAAVGLLDSKDVFGVGYKGFNDNAASWGSNRVMGQQCGQTWLQTFGQINSRFSPSHQLPTVQLATWDDYEEGTELETGIDNCVTIDIAANASGSHLVWSVGGNPNTIHHFSLFISTDGSHLMPLDAFTHLLGSATNSYDLTNLNLAPGTYELYVEAVGQPSMFNHISGPFTYVR